jgi:hypothetical protein
MNGRPPPFELLPLRINNGLRCLAEQLPLYLRTRILIRSQVLRGTADQYAFRAAETDGCRVKEGREELAAKGESGAAATLAAFYGTGVQSRHLATFFGGRRVSPLAAIRRS